MRLNWDARTHPLPFWTQRVPFLDAWIPSWPVFEPSDPSDPNSPIFGLADPTLPLILDTPTPFGRDVSAFWTHRPLHARFWTPRPLLAGTRPFFGRTDPTLPETVPFWDIQTPPAPFLDVPPISRPESSLFGQMDPFMPRFGHADPFVPRCVPFWTHRHQLAPNRPFLDAPTPSGFEFGPSFDASTPSCPFCPLYDIILPFLP